MDADEYTYIKMAYLKVKRVSLIVEIRCTSSHLVKKDPGKIQNLKIRLTLLEPKTNLLR